MAHVTEELAVESRSEFGSSVSRRLRKSGKVPCIVYKDGEDAAAFSADRMVLEKAISSPHVLKLTSSDGEKNVLVQEAQWEHLTNTLLHVDFKEIRMDQKIQTSVPLMTVGEPAGVTQGGAMDVVLHEIEVECLPTDIPEKIEVEVSELEIGDSITISALQMPENVVAVYSDENQIVVAVAASRVEEEPEAAEGEEGAEGEGAEGEAAEGEAAEGEAAASEE